MSEAHVVSQIATGPALVERRKADRRHTAMPFIDGFIDWCRVHGVVCAIQTHRELLSGRIVAQNGTSILVDTNLGQTVLLFKDSTVSISVPKA
jgi:hypothetical protein